MQDPLRFAHRVALGLASRARNLYYRSLGVRIQGYAWLRGVSIPKSWADITLEHEVALDDGVCLVIGGPPRPNKLVIGSRTYVNRYTIFDAHQQLHVGRRVMIGPHCYLTDADHGTAPGSSVQSQPMRVAPVVIEDEVWLGAHVTVLPGVRIGRGAVIGAGSVVTRSIPAMSVAAGVPAKILRYRDDAVRKEASEG
jgi:carbonic anhydrase/acetyltransferase-like protein (isoleucine patch superfamily)